MKHAPKMFFTNSLITPQRNTPIICAMGTSGDRLKDHLFPQCCSSMYNVYVVQYQYVPGIIQGVSGGSRL